MPFPLSLFLSSFHLRSPRFDSTIRTAETVRGQRSKPVNDAHWKNLRNDARRCSRKTRSFTFRRWTSSPLHRFDSRYLSLSLSLLLSFFSFLHLHRCARFNACDRIVLLRSNISRDGGPDEGVVRSIVFDGGIVLACGLHVLFYLTSLYIYMYFFFFFLNVRCSLENFALGESWVRLK